MKLLAVVVPSKTANRRAPFAMTAEIMFTLNRAPVTFTTGVYPTGAQGIPAW